jgi:hypothetical protein
MVIWILILGGGEEQVEVGESDRLEIAMQLLATGSEN